LENIDIVYWDMHFNWCTYFFRPRNRRPETRVSEVWAAQWRIADQA